MAVFKDYPIIYLWIYWKAKELVKTDEISRASFVEILTRIVFHIPKRVREEIIKDMEKLGLIKKINFMKFQLSSDINCSKILQFTGII